MSELKPWKSIHMPDGSLICIASRECDYAALPLFERNHSIFRLDKDGNVIWQITRDEGSLGAEWTEMRERAEAADGFTIYWPRIDINMPCDHFHDPFLTMILRFPDGSTNAQPLSGMGPSTAEWVEGATVMCYTLDSSIYELDMDTGVAINKTPLGHRPW